MPSRRCSGESTTNSPPNDQKAWPPRLCSPSWSTTMTRLPASAISVAATRPARPPPTTITSASSAIASPPARGHSTLHGVVFAIFCPGPAVHRRSDPVPTHHALALERDLGTNEIACPAKPPPTFALKGLKRVVLIAVNGKWFLCVACLRLDGDLTSGCSGSGPS